MVTSRAKPKRYIPDRGDAVWLTLDPQTGRDQAGRRPALSPAAYNSKTGLAIFCPVTTRVKGYPFEVILPEGLAVKGAVLADQIRNLDWHARNAARICALPVETMDEVLGKLAPLLAR